MSWTSNDFRSTILNTLKEGIMHCTIHSFSKRVNRCQGDGTSSVGIQTGGWYLGLVGPTSYVLYWVTDSM